MAYNVIYETLVNRARERNELLVGYVAYSLYKKQKAEFYQSQMNVGLPVTPDQMEIFHASFTPFALDNLEDQARQLLLGFAYRYLETDIAARERDIVEQSVATKVDQIDVNMLALKEGLTRDIARATSFSKAFWPGMATNLAFLIATAAIALAWALGSPTTMRNFLSVFAP